MTRSNEFEKSGPNEMMAWTVSEFGPPDVLKFVKLKRPHPESGEVLVKVGAVGVGPWDAWIRAGNSALPQPLPLTPGSDISGQIVEVGPDVTHLRTGDQVYGVTNPRFIGGYAEYAVASVAMVGKKPITLTDVEAASIPVVAVTAWQALFDQARLKKGDLVVIHGAAGNVGAYAVQFARRAGLRIIATALLEDHPYVRGLGADEIIDFQSARFEEHAKNVDAVIDLVGGETQTRSFQVLRRGGRLISAVSAPDQNLAQTHGVESAFFLVNVTSGRLQEIATLVDEGDLKTHVGAVLPLSKAMEAHLMLEHLMPQPKGKIVLRVE